MIPRFQASVICSGERRLENSGINHFQSPILAPLRSNKVLNFLSSIRPAMYAPKACCMVGLDKWASMMVSQPLNKESDQPCSGVLYAPTPVATPCRLINSVYVANPPTCGSPSASSVKNPRTRALINPSTGGNANGVEADSFC